MNGVWIRYCKRCGKVMFTIARTSKTCSKCNKSNWADRWEIPKLWAKKYTYKEILKKKNEIIKKQMLKNDKKRKWRYKVKKLKHNKQDS